MIKFMLYMSECYMIFNQNQTKTVGTLHHSSEKRPGLI